MAEASCQGRSAWIRTKSTVPPVCWLRRISSTAREKGNNSIPILAEDVNLVDCSLGSASMASGFEISSSLEASFLGYGLA